MHVLGIFPILLSAAAIVLGFLCIFAGSKRDFMETYDLLTVRSDPSANPRNKH